MIDRDAPEQVEARATQEDPIIMYLIVRESLGMGIGKTAAQCAHAAQMLTLKYLELCNAIVAGDGWSTEQDSINFEMMKKWLDTSFRKVVLKADDKEWKKLKELTNYILVIDAGLTEIAAGSETVIGIFPIYKSMAPKIVKKLQVLK